MRQVPDIAAFEIERLRADGVTVTDDDVVWLASLGRAVENPQGKTKEAAGLEDGLRLSDGTILKPLTLRAERWLNKYGPIFGAAAELLVVAFAMACRDRVDLTAKGQAVVDAVGTWAGGLNVTPQELADAVGRMLQTDEPIKPEADAPWLDVDTLVGFLTAATGLPKEYWENQTWLTADRVHAGICKHAAMMSGTGADPDKEAGKRALGILALAVREIRNRSENRSENRTEES